MSTPLRDLRVLDLTDLSGAYCGRLLAGLGAEVIRLAPPGASTSSRFYEAGKRSVVPDLDGSGSREQLLRLVRGCDVIVESSAAGVLGLAPRSLAEAAPCAVVCTITPFGQSGPYRHWRASDTVAQAMGGMVHVNGHPGEAPLRGFGLQAYHCASIQAAIAIVLAVQARALDGRGRRLDVSLQASVAASVEHVAGLFHQTGTVEERRGSLHWSRYFRVGRCRDGHVLHCLLGDWTSLVEWVKADGKAEDLAEPQFESFGYRQEHCERAFDILERWARDYTVAELVEGAQLRRVPYAAVASVEALVENEQLRARGFFSPAQGAESRGLGAEEDASLPPGPRPPAPSPLSGLRVLDFTWVVAGPVATRVLADHGAEVIKVERRDAADFGTRRGGLSGNLNRGKKSIVLDMSQPDGIAIARQLVARSDVVIDNFSARVMPNWGLDYDSLRSLRPGIIAVSLSGFGRSGPWRDYVSYGPTLQALAGFTGLMRHPGGEPAGWGYSFSDMVGGYSAALAVLAALHHRRRTGDGQFIDLSQFESLAVLLGPALLAVLEEGRRPEPEGNRTPEAEAAPDGIYRCADDTRERWCAITVFDDTDWRHFAAAIGAPPWTGEERFATAEARRRHRGGLDAAVEAWTRTRSAEEVMQTLQAAGVAAGIVADAEDLCRRDPQLAHRGYWVEVDTPEGDRVRLDGVPFHLDGRILAPRAPGPLLGEHTDEVLASVLDLDDERIAALRRSGAVG